MANGQGKMLLAPATIDSVNIAATDAAGLDLNVDIKVAKRLGLELVFVELGPGLGALDLEAGELFGVRHCVSR